MAKLGQELGLGNLDEILNSDSDDDNKGLMKVPDPLKDVAKITNTDLDDVKIPPEKK